MNHITTLIGRVREGDGDAFNLLFEALYPDLKRIAHARLNRSGREGPDDTTGLVHECYARLVAVGRLRPSDREHFLRYAARAMRSIIVDAARARGADRRGGDAVHVTLDSAVADAVPRPEDEILKINEALQEIERLHPRLAQVVEMRYFAGLTEPEVAQALGVTERTVRRDWTKVRLLLAAALEN